MDNNHVISFFAETVAKNVQNFAARLTEEYFMDAVNLIEVAEKAGGRVHITGIGKPGHIAGYGASLISSIGTPAYFLHGTEAVHGSCGQLRKGDVVICISNSGETAELKATVLAIKNNGCKIIGISGGKDSWLANESDVFMLAHVDQEGGPMNRAPISSILVESMVLQGLGVMLQDHKQLTPQEYVMRHPGGSLGQLRENEK